MSARRIRRRKERRYGHSFAHHVRAYARFWRTLHRGTWYYLRRRRFRSLRWPWDVSAPWRIVARTWRMHRADMSKEQPWDVP